MGGCRRYASGVLRSAGNGMIQTGLGYDVTTCSSCGNKQSSRNDSCFSTFCGAELFAHAPSEPRPASLRSPWWEDIDAPPPRVKAPILPVPAIANASALPAEPITAPLTMNAVRLVAPSPTVPVIDVVDVEAHGPSSEAEPPPTALIDAALAAVAGRAIVVTPDSTSPAWASLAQSQGVLDQPPPATPEPEDEPDVSERGTVTEPEAVNLAALSAASDPSTRAPCVVTAVETSNFATQEASPPDETQDQEVSAPTATLHVPSRGPVSIPVPTATLTWPGIMPAPRDRLPETSADAVGNGEAELESAEASTPSIATEVPTVELAASDDPAVVVQPKQEDAALIPFLPPAPPASSNQAATRPARGPVATADWSGVSLVSPAAGSQGSLADTWSRFLPTPSELRSVQMPIWENAGKSASPESVATNSSGDHEWGALSESERDVSEFQSLFRARFGRAASATLDGAVRFHRPVMAFERQLAANRQPERPAEGPILAAPRSPVPRSPEPKAPGHRPPSPKVAIDADASNSDSEERPRALGKTASAPKLPPPAPRPLVVGDDHIPKLPSDWRPCQ